VSLLLAVYVLRPHELWPELDALRPVALAGGLAILALIVEMLRGGRWARGQVSLWLLMPLAVWALAGVPWAVDPALARGHALALLKLAVVFYLFRHAMRDRHGFLTTMGTVLACASVVAVVGVHTYLLATSPGSYLVVLTGPNANASDRGIMLAVALPFALALSADRRSGWLRRAAAVAGVVLLAGIYATQSKGAMLATIVVVGAFTWRYRLRGVCWLAVAAGVYFLVPAVTAMTSPIRTPQRPVHYVDGKAHVDNSKPSVDHRVELLLDVKEKSYVGRIAIWRIGLELVRQHPVRGVGAGCFITAYSRAVDPSYPPDLRARSAHNTVLQGAAELGLPGGVLILGVLVGPFFALRRANARGGWHADGLAWAAVSAWLVAAWGACYLDHLENWILYAAIAAAEAVAAPDWSHDGPSARPDRTPHDDASSLD
jgi:hypothetical protein